MALCNGLTHCPTAQRCRPAQSTMWCVLFDIELCENTALSENMKTSLYNMWCSLSTNAKENVIVQKLIGRRWGNVFKKVHLEWLNKEYHIIRCDVVYSLSIRSSLLLTVIIISSLLNSSRRPACNSCRHATLWLRYKQSARAYNVCKQVWNLSEQRWEMVPGGW